MERRETLLPGLDFPISSWLQSVLSSCTKGWVVLFLSPALPLMPLMWLVVLSFVTASPDCSAPCCAAWFCFSFEDSLLSAAS